MDVKQAASAYNQIANIGQGPAANAPVSSSDDAAAPSFSVLVSNALSNAVDEGHKAEQISTLAMMGKADINQLAIAVSNAELALNTVVAVSSKMVSAYQQIMQMSI